MTKKIETSELQTGTFYRTSRIEDVRADGDEDDRRVSLAFSSEEPYRRYFGDEILDHGSGAIRLDFIGGGTAPLLVDHDRREQVGVVESVTVGNDRVGRAVVRFGKSARAEQELSDVRDGIRANVSVGYRINRMVLEEAGEEDDANVYRVVDWTPLEISIVSIPADTSVGVGREDGETPYTTLIEKEIDMPKENETAATPRSDDQAAQNAAHRAAEDAKAENEKVAARARDEARDAETTRCREIGALGVAHNMTAEAEKAISDGMELVDFQKAVLAKAKDTGHLRQHNAEDGEIGMSDNDVKQYSLLRALRCIMFPNDHRYREEAAFELECSAAEAKRMETEPQGIFVPPDVLRRGQVSPMSPDQIAHMKRDLNVGTGTAGGHLVSTDLLSGSFIEILRNRAVSLRAGATLLTGLVGNIAIPRQTTASTIGWISTEGGASAETAPAFDQVTMNPKTMGAFVDYTRQLLLQSSIDVENLVRNDLVMQMALALDTGVLYGTGSSGQPTGVSQQSGINTTTFAGADPTYAEVVAMETAVAVDNADVGTLAYITDAAMRGAFKTTEKASGTAQFIWEMGGTVNGYTTHITNQVTDGDVFFGNWADVFVGFWGGLDLTLDPYTGATSGTRRIVALQSADVAVRHPVSFCHSNDGS